MINAKERQILGMGEISVADYIEATVTVSKETLDRFLECSAKWRKSLAVDDAVRNRRNMDPKLARAVERRGVRWYADRHRTYASETFEALADMDREYYSITGRHIKGFTSHRNSTQKEQFLFLFFSKYNQYKKEHLHIGRSKLECPA